MPRYFFHLSFGERTICDEEGIDLPSRSAARAEATASIRELTTPKIGAIHAVGQAGSWKCRTIGASSCAYR